jgi:hypothetical protein
MRKKKACDSCANYTYMRSYASGFTVDRIQIK